MTRPWDADYRPSSSYSSPSSSLSPITTAEVLDEPTRWRRTKALLLLWLSERTTLAGLASAAVLMGGWRVAPQKIDAIALIVATLCSGFLIVFREKR